MKITKRHIRRIIRESMRDDYAEMGNFDRYSGQKAARNYNQISDGMKSMANAAKRKFAKDYPEVKVKIDGRQGWIIVNGVKAVNVSSASSRPMSIEDMVDQMKQAYLGHPMAEAKLKSSIRRIINERGTGNPAIQAEERALMNAVVEFSDAYMMTMGMNPGDSADAKRVRNTINDIINSVMGVL